MLWKHVDQRGRRRGRAAPGGWWSPSTSTVANYEYLVYWRFYQDGSIECEVRATGIMVTSHFAAPGSSRPYGTVVDHRTYAPFHQHFIVARLDLDVDGPGNTVYAVESEPAAAGAGRPVRARADGREHPAAHRGRGSAGLRLGSPARLEGRQHDTLERPRHPGRLQARARRRRSRRCSTRLPGAASGPRRSGTRCGSRPTARTSAGRAATSPSRREPDTGLPVWTAADRPIEDTDVVLWYVFGIHHITRPEDWPVMPADTSRSGSSRSASSTATPRLTCPRTGIPAANQAGMAADPAEQGGRVARLCRCAAAWRCGRPGGLLA